MRRRKHKRKTNRVLIVTSDAVDLNARQFRLRSGGFRLLIVLLCLIIGVMLGYLFYEKNIWQAVDARNEEQLASIQALEEKAASLKAEKLELETEIAGLNENIQILTETVNLKSENEAKLTEQLEEQALPTEFPLSGSASMEEGETDGNSICVFTASEGINVVATASGTVTAVNDDVEYGHNVWVDHGNGYVTIYRNGGEAMVRQGDSVVNGTPLFVIEEEHEKLGYQMMKDGVYISPMEMLAVSG